MSTVANPTAELPIRADDEILTPSQLERISFFAQLSKKPSFKKLPGTVVLRRFRRGEVIVRQGSAGWTAFYILKSQDVLELRNRSARRLKSSFSSEKKSPRISSGASDANSGSRSSMQKSANIKNESMTPPSSRTSGRPRCSVWPRPICSLI